MKITSDGSTAKYYELPDYATELQHLISHKNMNAQIGEVFRTCYRYGEASHSDMLREARKIRFYADAEIARLLRLAEPLPETRVQPWAAPDCFDSEQYAMTGDLSHDDSWRATDFGPCEHQRWHYYQSTHTKVCQNPKCGHIEPWHGG